MDQKELTVQNLGQSLDDLANIDPRGYGVCKILYAGAKAYTGEPLSTHAAKKLDDILEPGDSVILVSGFVLRPWASAETDGIISTMLLARSLVLAYGVRPLLICQDENMPAVRGLSALLGLHLYSSLEEMGDMPASMAAFPFTKDKGAASDMAERIAAAELPKAFITIEAPGENARGVYHNAIGLDVTPLEAKTDTLFDLMKARGVYTLSIGDLGNEMGMGTIADHIKKNIPYAAEGECSCGCGGGLLARTAADDIITATTSDWGCYALMAAIAYLHGDIEIFHDAELQRRAMEVAAECGMVDMYGWTIPAIDGFGCELCASIVTSMRECIKYSLALEKKCKAWFDRVLEKGYFQK